MATGKVTFKADHAGRAKILKSAEVRAALHEIVEPIASDVRAAKPNVDEVVIDDYTTDRAAVSVTIKDVRGLIWEVRDGFLTRIAASHGLEVTGRHR